MGSIAVISPSAYLTNIRISGGNPSDSVLSPNGLFLYICVSLNNLSGQNRIDVISTADNRVVGNIPISKASTLVAVSPDGAKLIVSHFNDNLVSLISLNTSNYSLSSVVTVATGVSPQFVRFSNDNTKAYVLCQDGSLSIITVSSATVASTVSFGSALSMEGMSFSSDESVMYTIDTHVSQRAYKVVLPTAGSPTATTTYVSCGVSNGSQIVLSNDNSTLYATTSAGLVTISTSGMTVSSTIALGSAPTGIVKSNDGTKVYVADIVDGTISVINLSTSSVTPISVGGHPITMTITSSGSKIFALNNTINYVTVLNTSDNTFLHVVSLVADNAVYPLVVSSDGSRAYVNSDSSGGFARRRSQIIYH